MERKISVMVLPVGLNCNLYCVYCYHGGKPRYVKMDKCMSLAILKKVFQDSCELAVDIDFIWHGGEPTLAGLGYFKEAITIQQTIQFNGVVRNILQTNATLLNDSWVEFIVTNSFLVSTSIDGPAEVHDINRCGFAKQKTFSLIVENVKKLRQIGKSVGTIVVVNKSNVNCPDEIYSTLRSVNVSSCAFHFCSKYENDDHQLTVSNKEIAEFLKQIFDRWFREDDPTFQIRNFRNVLRVMYGGLPLDCASNYNHCRFFIAITTNGDVYPCHRFVNRSQFVLGNVMHNTLAKIYETSKYVYQSMADIPEACFKCEWFKICGGGCAYERYITYGDFHGEHPECNLKKEIFSYIEQRVKEVETSIISL